MHMTNSPTKEPILARVYFSQFSELLVLTLSIIYSTLLSHSKEKKAWMSELNLLENQENYTSKFTQSSALLFACTISSGKKII